MQGTGDQLAANPPACKNSSTHQRRLVSQSPVVLLGKAQVVVRVERDAVPPVHEPVPAALGDCARQRDESVVHSDQGPVPLPSAGDVADGLVDFDVAVSTEVASIQRGLGGRPHGRKGRTRIARRQHPSRQQTARS